MIEGDHRTMLKSHWRAIMVRKSILLATAGALLLAAPLAPSAAREGWGHPGWHGGWHGGPWRGGVGLGLLGAAAIVGTTAAILSAPAAIAAPPVAYAPGPGYYEPPVVYAAPPPYYYGAPGGYYYRR
jgi:hypothetical protein